MSRALTHHQLDQLEITERVASCFSLIGTLFVFFTFVYSPAFRKPINRLLFFATWGNMAYNVGTLISQTGVKAGRYSHLCQFQAFLTQMFLPADALWNLAMAFNVYLTLFRKKNAQQLKSLEWRYHVMCYGCPFIVAFIYIFVNTSDRGSIYGPASLWCWIDIAWVDLRIATCYAPAWCCIILSFSIYLMAGREIFNKRQQLRAFSQAAPPEDPPLENPFTDFKTTEIEITSELGTLSPSNPSAVFLSPEGYIERRGESPSGNVYKPYTVIIGSTSVTPTPREGTLSPTGEKISAPATLSRKESSPPFKSPPQQRNNRAAMEANAAAIGYTKVACLFFISLLITWVPSSVNRVYSLIHPELVSVPFTFASGVVLPLMGFWNSVIYITTSWKAMRLLFTGRLPRNNNHPQRLNIVNKRHSAGTRRTGAGSDSESVRGFAGGDGNAYDQV